MVNHESFLEEEAFRAAGTAWFSVANLKDGENLRAAWRKEFFSPSASDLLPSSENVGVEKVLSQRRSLLKFARIV